MKLSTIILSIFFAVTGVTTVMAEDFTPKNDGEARLLYQNKLTTASEIYSTALASAEAEYTKIREEATSAYRSANRQLLLDFRATAYDDYLKFLDYRELADNEKLTELVAKSPAYAAYDQAAATLWKEYSQQTSQSWERRSTAESKAWKVRQSTEVQAYKEYQEQLTELPSE